jgi:Ca2+-binding RTX toxin-like protein
LWFGYVILHVAGDETNAGDRMSSFTSSGNATDVFHPSAIHHGTVSGKSATGFTVTASDGTVFHVKGTGLHFNSHGFPTGGTISGISTTGGPNAAVSITGAALDAAAFTTALGGSTSNFNALLYSGDDTFHLKSHGEVDLHGEAGSDTFIMGASLDSQDRINGGAGNDTVVLRGDYRNGLIFGNDTLHSVHELQLQNGFSYNLTLADGNVASNAQFVVDASAIGASHSLILDASAETDGFFSVTGGAYRDRITTGARADHIDGGSGNDVISAGGSNDFVNGGDGNDRIDGGRGTDTLQGGSGNDSFLFDNSLNTSDRIDGGAGHDAVYLSGNYGTGLRFNATTIQNVESVVLKDGSSYKLIFDDGNVAAGQRLIVDGHTIGAPHTLTVDASSETDGMYTVHGGASNDNISTGAMADKVDTGGGNDTINSGAGNDTVSGGDGDDTISGGAGSDKMSGNNGDDHFVLAQTFTAGDSIDGGAGNDTVALSGNYADLIFGANTMRNVETLNLAGSHSYDLTLADANVAGGKVLTVDAHTLTSGDTLTLDASHETDGAVNVTSGDSDDTITGGAGNDTFHAGGGVDHIDGGDGNDNIYLSNDFSVGDTIDGGAGSDTLHLSETGLSQLTLDSAVVQSIETVALDGDGANINLGANTSTSGPMTIDASGVTGNAVLDASNVVDGSMTLVGGVGDDTITGGAGNDILEGGLGADTLDGGGGSDTFMLGQAGDAIDTVVGFNGQTDTLNFANGVTNVGHSLLGGIASNVTDVAGLATGSLGANEAMVIKPLLGALGGDTFMVVDQNGIAGFQQGQDLVVQLVNATHLNDLSLDNFLG